jgi:metal-responsive CopG/Arc/MetJ family transcriptional regulator
LRDSGYPGYPRRMVKILVSFDEKLLARIDRAARRSGLTRSAYLAHLASREVEGEKGPGIDARARRGMDALEELFRDRGGREDSTGAVRADRDSR